MKAYALILVVLLAVLPISGIIGQTISARVFDAQTGDVIPDVFVFISNSSIGTTTDASGGFALEVDVVEQPELLVLVFSHLGYETKYLKGGDVLELKDSVVLSPRLVDLGQVVVTEKTRRALRARRMRVFRNEFLGKGPVASGIRITNESAILFTEDNGILHAISDEPLIIENKHLGYTIRYVLESFRVFRNGDVAYRGDAHFTPMEGEDKDLARFERNRARAFRGTSRHFFATLVQGVIDTSAYECGYAVFNSDLEATSIDPVPFHSLILRVIDTNRFEIAVDRTFGVHCLDISPRVEHLSGKQVETPYGQQKTTRVIFPISYFRSHTGRIVVNRAGAILNADEIEEFGYWAEMRTAQLLPFDYLEANIR